MRRKLAAERWTRDNLKLICGMPWRMSPEEKGDGELVKTEVNIMDKDYRDRMEHLEDMEHEVMPRNVYIKKEVLEEFRLTVGCPGCISVLKGTARQMHTDGCRRRLEKEMVGTEKAKKAKWKIDHYFDRKTRKDEAERNKQKNDGEKKEDVEMDKGVVKTGDEQKINEDMDAKGEKEVLARRAED